MNNKLKKKRNGYLLSLIDQAQYIKNTSNQFIMEIQKLHKLTLADFLTTLTEDEKNEILSNYNYWFYPLRSPEILKIFINNTKNLNSKNE